MTYRFHPEALEEYQEAARYYVERDPALALRFIEAVEDAIQRILEAPERWRALDDDVRPYACLPVRNPVHNRSGIHPYCCCDAW